jgi:hypothetical protein
MNDEELQLEAQRSLQVFDDARADLNLDHKDLGQKAIDALDSFIAYWNNKPFMQHTSVDPSEGGHDDLKQYAERQIEWAEYEKNRVRNLLTVSGDDRQDTA